MPSDTVEVTVDKVWIDTAEQQDKRPDSIKVQVKNGDAVVEEKEILNTETEVTFTGLTKYNVNGDEIIYTIAEAEVNSGDLKFYTASVDESTKTITNTFTVPSDTVEVTVNKVWIDTAEQQDKRPDSIKVQIKNGDTVVREEVISNTETSVSFTGLPKYDSNGNEITYTIAEVEVNSGDLKFYTSSVDESTKTITNTFTVPDEKVEIGVTKVWVDNNNSVGKRPASVIIVAKSGDEEKGQVELTVANALTSDSNTWVGTITNLPKYDSNGDEIVCTIDEKEVNVGDLECYIATINQETRTITNTLELPEEKVNIVVEKEWVDNNNAAGKRPTSIIIVAKSGDEEKGQVELTVANALEDNNNIWQGQIINLPKYDTEGNEIVYTIDEKEVNVGDLQKYTKEIIGNRIINKIKKVVYKVEHYRRTLDLEVEGYNCEEEYFEAIVGDVVTAIPKDYEGFVENTSHSSRIASGTVAEDGSLVLRLYYDRETYSISYVLNGGYATRTLTATYIYGKELYLSRKVEKAGYEFAGWYNNSGLIGDAITKIESGELGDKVFYAKWIPKALDSNTYIVDEDKEQISEVSPLTTLEQFLSNLNIGGNAKVYDLRGNEVLENELIGTGYTVKVDKDGDTYEYQVAVKGDLDGNGKISVTDLSVINQAVIGRISLEGIVSTAADLDKNGRISVTDLSMINQYITGRITF